MFVYMIRVVGRLTRDKASQEQVETFMSQAREKRRTLLQKFLQACSASKVPSLSLLVLSGLLRVD